MEAIFFKIQTPFEEAVKQVYSAIGIANYLEGESANVLGGIYSVAKIFGMTIKVEENSYDYEDDYNYSIFIKKDVLSDIAITEENVKSLSRVIAELLHRNLGIEIAIEVGDRLEVYPI